MPVLKIKLPFTFIARTINMSVGTVAMSLVFTPFAIKDVPIGVKENTATVGLAVAPPTLILGPVWPDLHTIPMSQLALPLTLIDSPVLKCVLSSELNPLLLLNRSMAKISVQLAFTNDATTVKLLII